MSDFPVTAILKPRVTIFTGSIESLGLEITASGTSLVGAGFASATYPTANLALFIPFVVTEPIVAVQLWCINGAAVSGNVDMGIYDVAGTKLVSIGSTAQSGTSVMQAFNITDTQLGTGRYFLAIALDNTTGTLTRATTPAVYLSAFGMAEMGTAFALPATATFAAVTNAYIPLIGLSTNTVL